MSDVIRPVKLASNTGAKSAYNMGQSLTGDGWTLSIPYFRAESALPSGNSTKYLELTDFDFSSVPNNAVVDGLVFQISRSGSFDLYDSAVRLVMSGNIRSEDKSLAGVWLTTPSGASYGSATDKWGENLTPPIIQQNNFGVALSISNYNASGTIGWVYECTATAYYSFPTNREGSALVYQNKFGNIQAFRPRSKSNNWVTHSGRLTTRFDDITYYSS